MKQVAGRVERGGSAGGARILTGRPVAEQIQESLKPRIAALREQGRKAGILMVRCGMEADDVAYGAEIRKLAQELGIEVREMVLPRGMGLASMEKAMATADAQARAEGMGVILMQPLPEGLRARTREICNYISVEVDVDGATDTSIAEVMRGEKGAGFAPSTAEACLRVLDYYGVECAGKRVAVIGRSLVVGRPVAMMLLERNATVTICHRQTEDIAAVTREAEVIVTAAGAAGSLTREMVRPGQVVVDVATNWVEDEAQDGEAEGNEAQDGEAEGNEAQDGEAEGNRAFGARGGRLVGDAVFDEVAEVVAAITPVPGGVGAVTTSVLMEHVVEAAERWTRNRSKAER